MDPKKGYWGCTPNPLNFEKERKQIKNRTKGNKKWMDHITHPRNISKQQTNWSKIYDYTTGWFKGAIISLENGCGLSFEQTCIHFTQGCLDSFCENWLKLAKWFWKKILKVFNVFYVLFNIHINKFESLHPRMLGAQFFWFWRSSVNVFWTIFMFCNYLSLGKGHGPSFKQTLIKFTQNYFAPSLVEISPLVLEKIFYYIL